MNKSQIVGWAMILLIFYFSIGGVVYFTSLLLLQKGILLNVPWIVSAQKSLYREGMGYRSDSWLRANCITEDPDLVYKPTIGSCSFNNIEFNTTLNFTGQGRNTGLKPEGTGIAVIGDSHAMGWGVNDEQTFSARLQKLANRPVYNLGVASYGTTRELIRLKKSGILEKVDTIILQYCNNDYRENLKFDSASKQELHNKVFSQFEPNTPAQSSKLQDIVRGYGLALGAPFRSLADRLRRKNFKRHYSPLISAIKQHNNVLQNKRIIVFYSNPYAQRYRNYPTGQDKQLANVHFVDLGLGKSDHYKLDNHPTAAGHEKIARRLFEYLQDITNKPVQDKHQSSSAHHADDQLSNE